MKVDGTPYKRIHLAAKYGADDIIQSEIDSGVSIDARSEVSVSVMHQLCTLIASMLT